MTRHIRAVYENGVFRPLEALENLPEHTPVRLRVEETTAPARPLSDFVGIWSAEEADAFSELIEREFGRVDEREW